MAKKNMQLSTAGAIEITCNEAIAVTGYYDSVKVATIGIGHTLMAGLPDPKSYFGKRITIEECFDLFIKKDVLKYVAEVNKALKVEVTQYEFDALVDFHYNTGRIASASITKLLNAGDKVGAAAAFMNFKKPPEIIERRKRSQALFRTGVYTQKYGLVLEANATGRLDWNSAKRVDVKSLITAYLNSGKIVVQPEEKIVAGTYLALGATGENVKAWQEVLVKLGYDPNGTDGVFGKSTDKATKLFQRDNGLLVDGRVGKASIDRAASLVVAKESAVKATVTETEENKTTLVEIPTENENVVVTVEESKDGNSTEALTTLIEDAPSATVVVDTVADTPVPVVPAKYPPAKDNWLIGILKAIFKPM